MLWRQGVKCLPHNMQARPLLAGDQGAQLATKLGRFVRVMGRTQDALCSEDKLTHQSFVPMLHQLLVHQLDTAYADAVQCGPRDFAPGLSHVWFMRYHNVRPVAMACRCCCCVALTHAREQQQAVLLIAV